MASESALNVTLTLRLLMHGKVIIRCVKCQSVKVFLVMTLLDPAVVLIIRFCSKPQSIFFKCSSFLLQEVGSIIGKASLIRNPPASTNLFS